MQATLETQQEKKPFYYQGSNKFGEAVSGIFYCFNEQRAKLKLRRRKVSLSMIYEKRKRGLFSFKEVKHEHIFYFLRQLAAMVEASVPLVEALRVIRKSSDHDGTQEMVSVMVMRLEQGHTLSDAMGEFPRQFDAATLKLVEMAGDSGILPQVLERLAVQKEQQRSRIAQLKKAMVYPAAMLFGEVILLSIMLLFVVPPLKEMYANIGAELPLLTAAIVSLSDWMNQWWAVLLVVGGGLTIGMAKLVKRSKMVQQLLQRAALRVGGVKQLVAASATSNLLHAMLTQLNAGIPVLQALRGTFGCSGNVVYDNACKVMHKKVERGESLSDAMQESGLLPDLVVQLSRTGEHTGDVAYMMQQAKMQIDRQVSDRLDVLTGLFETLLVVSLSVTIGAMVIAMYLPIFQLGGLV